MEAYASPDPRTSVDEHDDLFVIFSVAGQSFGVPHRHVLEMIQPPKPIPVPGTHPAVEGVINLRGNVLGLIDLRRALDKPSAQEELDQILGSLSDARRDHRAWIDELEASTREGRPFTLAKDQHECRFGRWFDSFEAQNDFVASLVGRLDEPHASLHGEYERVHAHASRGETEQALALIRAHREGTMAQLDRVLDETEQALIEMRREVAIILSADGNSPVALRVDGVDAIEALNVQAPGQHSRTDGHYVCGVATDKDDELVLLLDPNRVYATFNP